MDILGTMALWLKPLVPGWRPDRVADVANGLGETVLWTGSGFANGAVEDWLRHAVMSFLVAAFLIAVAIAFARAARHRTGKGRAGYAACAIVAAAISGLMSITGSIFVEGARGASGAYVLTARHLVVLTGEAAREDLVPSQVDGIRPGGEGVKVDLNGGRTVLIRANASEIPELVRAARTFRDGGATRT